MDLIIIANLAMSLEMRPLAALYLNNRNWCKCCRYEHTATANTESRDRDHSPIKHIFVWVGYNAARGLTSRDITANLI